MRIFVSLFLIIISLTSYGQQEPQFTMFWNNYSLFNPAYTGVQYKHLGAINYRNQWVGLDINPITLTANYDFKFDSVPVGIGIGHMHDQLGLMESDRAYLNLSYIGELNFGTISFGASGVYNQLTFDAANATFIDSNAPSTPTELVSQGKLNLNAGLFFKTKVLEVGISSSQINQPIYDQFFFKNARHYFVLVAYNFKLSNLLQLKSSLYAKAGGGGIFDLNNLLTYNNKYWTGVTIRPGSAVGAQAGMKLFDKFNIGYSYDHPTTQLQQYAATHEFILTLMIK